jgi:hypothetical protein
MRPRALAVLVAGCSALAGAAPAAHAAPPTIVASWVTEVTATSARLRAEINPNGVSTTYRFEYLTGAAYQANVDASREPFFGAILSPTSGAVSLGSGTATLPASRLIQSLQPATAYRYRVVATSSGVGGGTATGPARALTTQAPTNAFSLPDGRAWELVSPVDKGGGAIAAPGALFGGGHFQAAAGAGGITYSSATAFGEAAGAPPASQYLSRRAPSGWATANVSAPLSSGAYGDEPDGAPYRLFSSDLGLGLLSGGRASFHLRSGDGALVALLSDADLAHTAVAPENVEVSLAAASPDLSQVVLSSCAALTADAVEVMTGPGECDPAQQNLYRWSSSGLVAVNLLPGETESAPGAAIAAPSGSVFAAGPRVYWTHAGDLYLHTGSESVLVRDSSSLQVASEDGGVAYFLRAGHLHRFLAATQTQSDLTPAGGVQGVLGASADGAAVYYQHSVGIRRWRDGASTLVVPVPGAAAAGSFPPATGTARVSADGRVLAFLSTAELTGYESGIAGTELFVYDAGADTLRCASCNPTGERAQGPSSIPGALVNGTAVAYKPRVLTADGRRLFFESSDKLSIVDTNSRPDVYQWEVQGKGGCGRPGGCVDLISSGRSDEGATLLDASADGSDVYFLTDGSLVGSDPGWVDVYDARVGGGIAEPPRPIPCIGDACQVLPSAPDDPAPGTLVPNAGNPPLKVVKEKRKRKKHARGKPHRRSKGKRGTRR